MKDSKIENLPVCVVYEPALTRNVSYIQRDQALAAERDWLRNKRLLDASNKVLRADLQAARDRIENLEKQFEEEVGCLPQ